MRCARVGQHVSGGQADGLGYGLARERIAIKVLYESSGFGGVHCPPTCDHMGHSRTQKGIGDAVESVGPGAAGSGAASREHRQLQILQVKMPYHIRVHQAGRVHFSVSAFQ